MPRRFAAVRTVFILILVCTGALITGCSGSGGGGTASNGNSSACPLIQKLDEIVAGIPTKMLADPVAFKKTLDGAVDQYAATVRRLKRVVPASVQPDLERVEADVNQYRFADAVTHRASLDAYAQRECKRPVASSSVVGATTTTLAA